MLTLRHHRHRRVQTGVMLLEVLIALLIFALGVLGLVGLQANAVKQSGQAKYRADATLLANELIGQMWVSARDYASLQASFTGTGGPYTTWLTKVQAELPGASACPPTVSLTQVQPLNAIVAGASAPATGLTSSTQVSITMRWRAPDESMACTQAHNIVLTNQIK